MPKDKKKKSKRKVDGDRDVDSDAAIKKKSKKKEKKKSKDKKKKRKLKVDDDTTRSKKRRTGGENEIIQEDRKTACHFPFEYQHIVAPMVGASELAFRLLCRKYGATLSYTPMMSSTQFVKEAEESLKNSQNSDGAAVPKSNICEFQTIPQDRPLVVHFSANNPDDFARAAKLVEPYCDAVDLNLGCPQRTACKYCCGHIFLYYLKPQTTTSVC